MSEREIKSDSYLEKLYKIIPIEITAAYVSITSIVASSENAGDLWYMLVISAGLLFVLNPFYLIFVQNVLDKKQVVLSTLSFPLWAANTSIEWFPPGAVTVGLAAALILWTLVIPIVKGGRNG